MYLLALDLGSTHIKAGLFTTNGQAVHLSNRPTETKTVGSSISIDPEQLWQSILQVMREVLTLREAGEVAAVGVASMAETGLLVDVHTGKPRTALVPWFDTSAQSLADSLLDQGDVQERFLRTGIRPTFKCSLAKILWLREYGISLEGARWLSAADYAVYRLSGSQATDPSLAGRTYAFRLDRRDWDSEYLETLGLSTALFPPVKNSGLPAGGLDPQVAETLGLPKGIPVAVCGHDHVCAAFAAGAVQPGRVFDSMGTAEALLGAFPERPLTEADFRCGLMFGCHSVPGSLYWMGGLSASGGSVEWLLGRLGDPALTYEELDQLLAGAPCEPTGILYFPYLLGSGSPHSDPHVRAAWIGLDYHHSRADLALSVLEGAAYEAEVIRSAGEQVSCQPVTALVAAGGGTRNTRWLQIKADVSGCTFEVPSSPEAALQGAALLAGLGAGVYRSEAEMRSTVHQPPAHVISPNIERHDQYRSLYEKGYLAFQEPLRHIYIGKA